jgi:hypothetical protein
MQFNRLKLVYVIQISYKKSNSDNELLINFEDTDSFRRSLMSKKLNEYCCTDFFGVFLGKGQNSR